MAKKTYSSPQASIDNRTKSERLADKKRDFLKERSLNSRYAAEKRKDASSFFGIILLLLLTVALFWNLTGKSTFPTLQSFLELLQEVPSISTDWISFVDFNLDLPDWLGWLNSILDFLEGIFQLGSFVVVGLLNVVPFIVFFLKWIFL